jgi:hypothetical protein
MKEVIVLLINEIISKLKFSELLIRASKLLISLFVMLSASGIMASESWVDPAWKYRQKIVIKDGFFATNTDLKDFPVLIQISDSGNPFFKNARGNGGDLLFTGADGKTRLAHELETFSVDKDKRIVCWVKVPILYSEGDTVLFLYYGNSGLVPAVKSSDVWSDGFAGVWHIGNGSGEERDSTANGNNGKVTGSVPSAEGKIFWAGLFDGEGLIQFGTAPCLSFDKEQSFTLELWVQCLEIPMATDRMASNNIAVARKGWGWGLNYHSSCRWDFSFKDSPSNKGKNIQCYSPDRDAINKWRYLTMVYQAPNKTVELYVDGIFKSKGANKEIGSFACPKDPFSIGGPPKGVKYLIDEVRLSGKIRTAEWISACYKNQNSQNNHIKIGLQEKGDGK